MAKTVLITGASLGFGELTAQYFQQHCMGLRNGDQKRGCLL